MGAARGARRRRQRRAGQAAGAAETAVALLRRLARAVQQTAAEDRKFRSEGLDTLSKALTQNLPDATVAELLHSFCQPLLRRFEDPVEKLREKAIRLMAELCRRVSKICSRICLIYSRCCITAARQLLD